MKRNPKKTETILFMGDSITDCGRRGPNAPLGDGFAKVVGEMYAIRQPAKAVRFINKGISGNTVSDLQERWTDDVVEQKPDTLVLMIGINDLCRTVGQSPGAVPPDRFAKLYDELMARTAEALPNCRMILLDPFYITRENAPTSIRHTVLNRLNEYIRVVHTMARKYKTGLIQTHNIFRGLLKYHKPEVFCPEPVHPNHTGHLVLAEAVYAALTGRPGRARG
ncbi:MAG: SGNH/GDSL hydrolase family protein [Kiritimatiellia bacterium]